MKNDCNELELFLGGAMPISRVCWTLQLTMFFWRRQLTSINSVKRLRRKTASTTTTLSASNVETSYASTTAASKAGASATSAASARSSSSTNVYFLALLLSGILLLGLFTVKTWTRNYDWNSRRALFR